eukprot:scaffold115103_cov69-Phaeocystis_antarctica.AAC.1
MHARTVAGELREPPRCQLCSRLPRAADGFMVLDEFYEAMQDLIAKKIFPDVTALTKDESDEIFLDVCRRPAPAALRLRRDTRALRLLAV